MQFKIFKGKNIIQGISDSSFGSMAGKKRDERAIKFLKSLGYKVNIENLVWVEQVFGAKVHICKIKDSGKIIKGADGLISDIRNQVLAIVSADCVPILFFDPKREVVAALHGARESLIKGIIENAVSKMISKFHSSPGDILVGIGPHIRKCHYWLKEKTYQKLKNTKYKKYFIDAIVIRKPWQPYYNKKIYFDLTKLVFGELLKSGIKKKNIEDCGICTYCQSKKYFSARKKEEDPKIYNKQNLRFTSFIGMSGAKVWKISSKNFKDVAKEAIKSIERGGVLVCPTDTVYGLVCDATNKKAVEKLFKIKRRSLKKPVPIFVKDIKTAKKLAYIDKSQEKILKKVWFTRPNFKETSKDKIVEIGLKIWVGKGKVTAILKRKKGTLLYGVDKETIGLRIPKHKLILELLRKTNKPLTGTSANVSGQPPSIKIKEVINQFQSLIKFGEGQPDLILDAGNLARSKPSTVINLFNKKPKILRKGEKISSAIKL